MAGMRRKSNDEGGIPNYEINPNLRYNFANKCFVFHKKGSKNDTYLDTLMKQKAKIPSPDKYAHMHSTLYDPKKKFKIYPYDKKSAWDDIIKKAKLTPASNFYDKNKFDEERIKPPKGYPNKMEAPKASFIDDAIV